MHGKCRVAFQVDARVGVTVTWVCSMTVGEKQMKIWISRLLRKPALERCVLLTTWLGDIWERFHKHINADRMRHQ